MIASEIAAAGLNSDEPYNIFPSKTITSKFLLAPSFSNNAGIPLTDPLRNSSISAFLIISLALSVLATPYTPCKSYSLGDCFGSSVDIDPELITSLHSFSLANCKIVFDTV